jgi:hypothetical protein
MFADEITGRSCSENKPLQVIRLPGPKTLLIGLIPALHGTKRFFYDIGQASFLLPGVDLRFGRPNRAQISVVPGHLANEVLRTCGEAARAVNCGWRRALQ